MKPLAPLLCLLALAAGAAAEDIVTLPGTQPLTMTGDLSAQMVAGIDAFLSREIEQSAGEGASQTHTREKDKV